MSIVITQTDINSNSQTIHIIDSTTWTWVNLRHAVCYNWNTVDKLRKCVNHPELDAESCKNLLVALVDAGYIHHSARPSLHRIPDHLKFSIERN